MAKVDLGESVQKVLQDLQPQIQAQNAIIDLGETWHSVRANDSVLSQIITNLLTNALKFVERGVRPRIRIWSEAAALNGQSSSRLFIKDNGLGIPPETQQRLFQPFQRGTTDTQYQGTGMGLAIVQKGAERLGGKIGFTSKPGEGSCFWVELPDAALLESNKAHEQTSPASR
jgi:signal transduction histidine kinase